MKRSILFLILIFSMLADGLSQSCLPNGINFNTQSEIDNFQTNYPGCTKIGGHVRIDGSNITNVNGLINITNIEGSLIILTTYNLSSLEGLSNLDSIEGNLDFNINSSLVSFSGLENLTYIGGDLSISNFDLLYEFTGLNNLITIGGHLFIANNDTLYSLSGLDNLTTIGGGLGIANNPYIVNFEGLNNLTSVGSDLTILKNQNLVNLTGLEGLISIAGDIRIGYYPNGGCGNSSLSSLSGIENIAPHTIANLYISDNSTLSVCEVKSICDYLSNPNGIIAINSNKYGCNTQNEVEEACIVSVYETEDILDFSIYPNPAQNNITISGNSTMKDLVIYNSLGQMVLHSEAFENPIDISMIDQGLYIIEFIINQQRIKKKLFIKR